jgi:hypothetical protein
MKINIICPSCKSTNISADGILYWNIENQRWELEGVLDDKCCNECGYEGHRFEEIEIEETA